MRAVYVAAAVLLAIGIGFGLILRANGHLVYTLDDPYIHLALARQIAHGHYGINPGEFSAPSSSILWPFLLGPVASWDWAVYAPLAINAICAVLTILAAGRVLSLPWLVLFAILTNSVGLVFTGMEHSLQVLLATTGGVGLVQYTRSKETPWWWIAALIVQPSIRYENILITFACCYVLWKDHRKLALWTLAGSILPLILFSVFLKSLGLSALPSSIIAKDAAGTGANPLFNIARNCYRNLFKETRVEAWTMLVAAAWVWIVGRKQRTGVAFALAGFAHIVGGRFGWLSRYESYMVAFLILGVSLSWESASSRKREVMFVAALVGAYVYLSALLAITFNSHRIYVQQFQMARFVHGWWRRPVAVNDLGLVSWGANAYVLDLWGLASEDARKGRASKRTGWMQELVKTHQVDLVMIYDHWLPEHEGWIKVGSLVRHENNESLDNQVSIYATRPEAEPEIRSLLRDFAKTLPRDASITLGR